MSSNPRRIVAVCTQGSGGDDEARLRELLSAFSPRFLPFDARAKRESFARALSALLKERPDLLVLEGTGIAGGLAALLARLARGVPYVVSSGDAVAPFLASRHPWLAPAFALYERMLCRFSRGYIGWSPYLAGRALAFGAPRAMTAAGWAPRVIEPGERAEARARIRRAHSIPEHALVIGIAGSLAWNRRVGFCYGLELAQAMSEVRREDCFALIVGDGEGRRHIEAVRAQRVVLAGRIPREAVPEYLAAMDLASLPQSVDGVGSFRYTTKLSEYLAAGLPVATGRIPLSYDLPGDWLWRLPGDKPWGERYANALAELLERLDPAELALKREATSEASALFDRGRQVARVTEFVSDVLESDA